MEFDYYARDLALRIERLDEQIKQMQMLRESLGVLKYMMEDEHSRRNTP